MNRTYPEGGRGTADLRYDWPLPAGTRPPSGALGANPGHGQADTAPTSAASPSPGTSVPATTDQRWSNPPGPLRGGAAGLHQLMCGEDIGGRVLRHPEFSGSALKTLIGIRLPLPTPRSHAATTGFQGLPHPSVDLPPAPMDILSNIAKILAK